MTLEEIRKLENVCVVLNNDNIDRVLKKINESGILFRGGEAIEPALFNKYNRRGVIYFETGFVERDRKCTLSSVEFYNTHCKYGNTYKTLDEEEFIGAKQLELF